MRLGWRHQRCGREEAPAPEPTHVLRPAAPGDGSFASLVLFTRAIAKERAADLLLALAPAKRAQAEAELQRIAALDSSARQALVLRAFGERTDAADRARELLASCPSLGAELRSELPPRYRPQGWTCASKPATRARAALCERLVREALQ